MAASLVTWLFAVGWLPAGAQGEPPVSVRIVAAEAPSMIRNDCVMPVEVTTHPGSFTLGRVGPDTEPLTVAYTVTGEVLPTGGSADLASGEETVAVPLELLPDATDLTITIEVLDGDGYELGDPVSVTIVGTMAIPLCAGPPEPPIVDPTFTG